MSDWQFVDILLVEDSAEDLELAVRALRKARLSINIEVARDGEEALDFIFGEGPYSGRDLALPKLILLDLKLPKVSGLQVLQRLKNDVRTQTIPVVVLTSSKEQSDLVESYRLGVNSFVVKPVNFDGFLEAVQKLASYWLQLNQTPSYGPVS